jgi:hypothetical protein
MKLSKNSQGDIDIDLNLDELSWFGQALNECCGGFGVKDYKATLGAEEDIVRQLLDQIVAMYPSTLGQQSQNADR